MISDQRRRDTRPLAVVASLLAGNMIAALLILRLQRVANERPPRSIDWALGVAMCLLLVSGNPPALGTTAVLSKLIFCSVALCAAFADRSAEGAAFGTIAAALACAMLPALPDYPWPLVGLAIVVALAVAGHTWAGPLAIAEMLWAIFWSIHVGDQVAALPIVVLGVVAIALRLRGGKTIRRVARWAMTPLPMLIAIAIIGLARALTLLPKRVSPTRVRMMRRTPLRSCGHVLTCRRASRCSSLIRKRSRDFRHCPGDRYGLMRKSVPP